MLSPNYDKVNMNTLILENLANYCKTKQKTHPIFSTRENFLSLSVILK